MKFELTTPLQVESFLREWGSREEEYPYDFIQMCGGFFGACLENLKANALDVELEDIEETLTSEQIDMLKKLCKYI